MRIYIVTYIYNIYISILISHYLCRVLTLTTGLTGFCPRTVAAPAIWPKPLAKTTLCVP